MLRVDGKLKMACAHCCTMLYFMGKLERAACFDIDRVNVTIYEMKDGVSVEECRKIVGDKCK